MPDGWADWNKLTLDQCAEYLYNKNKYLSSGEAHCICRLIDFYESYKHFHTLMKEWKDNGVSDDLTPADALFSIMKLFEGTEPLSGEALEVLEESLKKSAKNKPTLDNRL